MRPKLELTTQTRIFIDSEFYKVEIALVRFANDPIHDYRYQFRIKNNNDEYREIKYLFYEDAFINKLPFPKDELKHYIVQFRDKLPIFDKPKDLDAGYFNLDGDPNEIFLFPDINKTELQLMVCELLFAYFDKYEDRSISFFDILHSFKIKKSDLKDILRTYRGKGIIEPYEGRPDWYINTNEWYILLKKEIDDLSGKLKETRQLDHGKKGKNANATNAKDNRKIFIVHGHDEMMKETTARFIGQLKLEPIILHEQTSMGLTIPEKLERHSGEVGYAVILLTPDDICRSSGKKDEKKRARQNVILELGFFWGLLGREKIHALYVPDVEVPSDYLNVVYTEFDKAGAWKQSLFKELKKIWDDLEFPT